MTVCGIHRLEDRMFKSQCALIYVFQICIKFLVDKMGFGTKGKYIFRLVLIFFDSWGSNHVVAINTFFG